MNKKYPYYYKRIREHLCFYCGKSKPEGWTKIGCPVCSDKKSRYSTNRYHERKSSGLCTICGEPNTNGLIYCPKCQEINRKIRPQKKEYLKNRLRENKIEMVKRFGGKCNHCGFVTDILGVYEFHHIKPETKIKKASIMKISNRIEESKKCIMLCANCHRILHHNLRNNH